MFSRYRVWFSGPDFDPLSPRRAWCCLRSGLHFWALPSMYCHPSQVKKWSKALKPDPKLHQIEQARLMRSAKKAKQLFSLQQLPLDFEKCSKL